MSHCTTFVHILRVVLISQTSYCCVVQLVGNNYEFRIRLTQLKSGIHVGVSDAQTSTVRRKPKITVRERIIERMSMRITLQVLNSFDLIITATIMQSDDESVSVSVNSNGHRGASVRETVNERGRQWE